MKFISPILTAIFILNVSVAPAQVKSLYAPYEYSSDTVKNVLISSYMLDSLKYEALYYKDLLEETKRNNFILLHTFKTDSSFSGKDSAIINFYSKEGTLILKKLYEYKVKGSYFLTGSYYMDRGKLSYCDRSLVTDNLIMEDEKGNRESMGTITQLQTRSRYVYNEAGQLIKAVTEIRMGGAAFTILRYTNNNKDQSENYLNFPKKKISIWEFWD